MTTPTDGEWMSAEDALAFLGMPHAVAVHAICVRAHAGLIKAMAKRYISGDGRSLDDADVPREFWWARDSEDLQGNWRTGDFSTMAPNFRGQLRAFGVEFRRTDIEQMRPASTAASTGGTPSSTRTPAPTDGEWMSAQEALDYLGLGFANGAHAICAHAFAELIQAKARRFLD